MQQFISLMFHNVYDNETDFKHLSPSITSYFVDQTTFGKQIEVLRKQASCLNSPALARFYNSSGDEDHSTEKSTSRTNQSPRVQITFDDGWLGTVELAGPILEKNQYQALMFVTTDLIDAPLFVSRSDLQNLSENTFKIGSHARTHRLLNRLTDDEIREELVTSKQTLEDIMGYEVDALSIPGGASDHRVQTIAAETGYRYLYTSEVQANTPRTGPFNIGRVPIRQNTSLADFQRYVQHRISREQFRRQALKIPKYILGQNGYAALRSWLLGESSDQQEMITLSQPEHALQVASASNEH